MIGSENHITNAHTHHGTGRRYLQFGSVCGALYGFSSMSHIRSIKHSMHLDFIRAKSPDMVHKEIWCHMLAYNLLRGTMVESAKRNDTLPRQLSVMGAMQAIESFTPDMMATKGNEVVYDALLKTLSAHRVGNRPGRQEPRYKKRRPTWIKLMTVPRSKSHRRLAAAGRAFTASLT